jgi:hypothetical protein
MTAVSAPIARPQVSTRMIVTSFATGVGLMMLAGAMVTASKNGGLAMPSATAATLEHQAPLIEPLDIVAIQAELAGAEAAMQAAAVATDPKVAQLERLAGRR